MLYYIMEINIDNIYNLLYPNYQKILLELETIYSKDLGYYVFKRKKLDSQHYNAYLKANKGISTIQSLTFPAFPKYLLPPKTILYELNKSPKLSLNEGFRPLNWNDVIGDYFCDIENIEVKSKKYLSETNKLLKFLNTCAYNDNLINKDKNYKYDEYVYSLYKIEKIDKLKFHCSHIVDITQKNDKTYSLKSDNYTQYLQPYTIQFIPDNNSIYSEYEKYIN